MNINTYIDALYHLYINRLHTYALVVGFRQARAVMCSTNLYVPRWVSRIYIPLLVLPKEGIYMLTPSRSNGSE